MLDYVVAKIPKWAFEKFKDAEPVLGTQMKSVGEVMAIGRTFKEAMLKGIRSLETGRDPGSEKIDTERVRQNLTTPNPDRLNYLMYALSDGMSVEEIAEITGIDPWFLNELREVVDLAARVRTAPTLDADLLLEAKRSGFSDHRIASLRAINASEVARARQKTIRETGI